MMQVAKQFVRIFADNGKGDKDFSEPEERLRQAQHKLLTATDLLKQTSEILSGLIKSKGLNH